MIRAKDLHPEDSNGKADPYIVLNLESDSTSDKDNYVPNQLSPVFTR